jgi:hypothetical protein
MTTNTIYYPTSGLNPKVPGFLTNFFRVSDDVNGAEEYPHLFTPDASFKFASIRMSGTDGSSLWFIADDRD